MRTTVVIPDVIFHQAKEAAKAQGRTLSDIVAEALIEHLSGDQKEAETPSAPYKIKPVAMGVPQVDVNDREALSRGIDERQ